MDLIIIPSGRIAGAGPLGGGLGSITALIFLDLSRIGIVYRLIWALVVTESVGGLSRSKGVQAEQLAHGISSGTMQL